MLSSRCKLSAGLAGATVCLLVFASGCTQTATLELKLATQDSTTYKAVTLAQKGIEFEGSLPEGADFKGGRNQKRIEMTFTQQVQGVTDKGNAVAKITIKHLKYYSTIRDRAIVNFDSSREEDRDSPLSKLIGQSYTIEIAPTGEVTEVIDVKRVRAMVGGYLAGKAMSELFSTDTIKERHGRIALPADGKNQLRPGDNYSGIKTFSFGMMGSKTYERIYTLKQIEDTGDQRIAIVDMNAIPSSAMAEQLHKEQTTLDFSKMFDNTETYAGRLKLDLTAGEIEQYHEKLLSEWIMVDPSAGESDKEPGMVRMSAIRLYSLERID